MWSLLLSKLLAFIGGIAADVLKDWFSKPDVLSVETISGTLTEDDLGGLPAVDGLLSDWERVPGNEI